MRTVNQVPSGWYRPTAPIKIVLRYEQRAAAPRELSHAANA